MEGSNGLAKGGLCYELGATDEGHEGDFAGEGGRHLDFTLNWIEGRAFFFFLFVEWRVISFFYIC